ncbi:MAG: hypothetical protein CMB06_04255 [Euryarchaeota archaeon]|nr:hypothetical protein [Euryarchaeota archaeon]|tara:strand:- start:10 stop:654 length:645 start_codon:yes stop_codon:yes gene_type:complete
MENLDSWLIIILFSISILLSLYFYRDYIFQIAETTAPTSLALDSDDHPHYATPLSQVKKHSKDEVFHVAGHRVPYNKAEKVCSQYNSKLANYDQLIHAYQHGAEWCNYGWSQDQLALYPTQKGTWESIQNAENEKDRNMCGHYGINGGKFDRKMKFGVNCYGERPPAPESGFVHPDLPKPKEVKIVKKRDRPIDDLVVVPYNRVRWQRDMYPVS